MAMTYANGCYLLTMIMTNIEKIYLNWYVIHGINTNHSYYCHVNGYMINGHANGLHIVMFLDVNEY